MVCANIEAFYGLVGLDDDAPMPTIEEAFARLRHLEIHGATDFAF